jgi:hypothetical protein
VGSEFTRKPGNVAISSEGFEVSVNGGMDVAVKYSDASASVRIPAERTRYGGIGLFMEWAEFPVAMGIEERREIFLRVVRALRFMDIAIDSTEIDPEQKTWPLPPK